MGRSTLETKLSTSTQSNIIWLFNRARIIKMTTTTKLTALLTPNSQNSSIQWVEQWTLSTCRSQLSVASRSKTRKRICTSSTKRKEMATSRTSRMRRQRDSMISSMWSTQALPSPPSTTTNTLNRRCSRATKAGLTNQWGSTNRQISCWGQLRDLPSLMMSKSVASSLLSRESKRTYATLITHRQPENVNLWQIQPPDSLNVKATHLVD